MKHWIERLSRATDADLGRWRGVGDATRIVVVGDDLPWVEGLEWLGVDADAPGLYLPCLRAPEVHPALLARRIPLPAALLEDAVVPLAQARPLARDVIASLA